MTNKTHKDLFLSMIFKKYQFDVVDKDGPDTKDELLFDLAMAAIAAGVVTSGETMDDLKTYAKTEISKIMVEMEFEIKKNLEKMNDTKSNADTRNSGK